MSYNYRKYHVGNVSDRKVSCGVVITQRTLQYKMLLVCSKLPFIALPAKHILNKVIIYVLDICYGVYMYQLHVLVTASVFCRDM